MGSQTGKWAVAAGLPWHFARLAWKAARAPGAPKEPVLPRKVLVLGYAAIGDLIFLLPALRALRRGLPGARIVFLADRYAGTEEVLPASGLVDEIWLYEHAELAQGRTRRELAHRVAEAGFDSVVATGATPMRAFAAAILGVPLRVGHCRPLKAPHAGWSPLRYALWRLRRGVISEEFERRLSFNRKVWVAPDAEHMVRRNLRLVEALGLRFSEADEAAFELPISSEARAFAERSLPASGRLVGLHLGSPRSQYAKLWPLERWAAVAREVVERLAASLVLLGGPDEKETARAFAAAYGKPFVDLAGRCKFLESLAVLRRCELFMANDTGLAKAAMALGVPTATVWGPSDRPGWGAFWEREKHLEVYREMPCSPCVRMGLRNEGAGVINFETCGHRACLNELSAEEVCARVLERYAR